MSRLPLLGADSLETPLAWRGGRPIARGQYLADVQALAARLPARGAPLSLSGDRYRFAVGLGAAMLRGHTSLLPPNHTPDMIERLRGQFVDVYALADPASAPSGLPTVVHDADPAPLDAAIAMPMIDGDQVVARVLTSGSTGAPVPHPKPWALLVASARAEADRLAESMGLRELAGTAIVGTVPAQHMYGFESTVLLSLTNLGEPPLLRTAISG